MDLPLNGRFFTRLAVLTAGTLPTAPGARDERTGGFSANGVRPYQNNYLLDGIDNNSLSQDLTNESSFVYGPSPDAIQEFKVQTNSMSAEFGRSGGAVMNVTIKSGTNGFHGSVFEFLRNSKLDAKNFFDSPAGPDPAFQAEPIWSGDRRTCGAAGYNGKNRTFFFTDYQGTRIRTAHTFLATLAPLAWRTGDFSAASITVLDPNTTIQNAYSQPFPDNQIPLQRFDAASLKLIALMPAPNVPGSVSANRRRAITICTNPIEPNNTDQGDVRIDHKISDKDSLFARFSMADQTSDAPVGDPASALGGRVLFGGLDQLHAAGDVQRDTYLFSARDQ